MVLDSNSDMCNICKEHTKVVWFLAVIFCHKTKPNLKGIDAINKIDATQYIKSIVEGDNLISRSHSHLSPPTSSYSLFLLHLFQISANLKFPIMILAQAEIGMY